MRTSLITIATIIILIGAAAMLLPKGFSGDLSRIGQGINTVVLVHNKESVNSLELMTLLNKVRGDYDGRIEFLIADISSATGKAFVSEQQLRNSVLVLFDTTGQRLNVLANIADEATLRQALNKIFRDDKLGAAL